MAVDHEMELTRTWNVCIVVAMAGIRCYLLRPAGRFRTASGEVLQFNLRG